MILVGEKLVSAITESAIPWPKLTDSIGAIAFNMAGSSTLLGSAKVGWAGWLDFELVGTPIRLINEFDGKTVETGGNIIFLILFNEALTASSTVLIFLIWLLIMLLNSYWFFEIFFSKSIFFRALSTEQ